MGDVKGTEKFDDVKICFTQVEAEESQGLRIDPQVFWRSLAQRVKATMKTTVKFCGLDY